MFFGKRTIAVSNGIINAPPRLPVFMVWGTVTWSLSFETFPTATLTYKGVNESDLITFKNVYGDVAKGKEIKVQLGEIDFLVDRYGYTEQPVPNTNSQSVYQVTVVLKSLIEK